MRALSGRISTSRNAFDRLDARCGRSSRDGSGLVTARAWFVLGIVAAVGGFALLMLTLPKVQESQTVLRQLAIAVDPGAAKEAARLRQQYDASLAIMVAGLVAVAYAFTVGIRRSR